MFEPCGKCEKTFEYEAARARELEQPVKINPGRYCVRCVARYDEEIRQAVASFLEARGRGDDDVVFLEELNPWLQEKVGFRVFGNDRHRALGGLRAHAVRRGDKVGRGFYTGGLTSSM